MGVLAMAATELAAAFAVRAVRRVARRQRRGWLQPSFAAAVATTAAVSVAIATAFTGRRALISGVARCCGFNWSCHGCAHMIDLAALPPAYCSGVGFTIRSLAVPLVLSSHHGSCRTRQSVTKRFFFAPWTSATALTQEEKDHASASTAALFEEIEAELAKRTSLREELHFIVDEGRKAAPPPGAGLEVFEELLTWLKALGNPVNALTVQSLGPLAVAALRHPGSGREVVILGTPHIVAGLSAEKNPVPAAVRQAIRKIRPDLVAVELDKARGNQELQKLPSSLWGRAAILLPAKELDAAAMGRIPELRMDEGLLRQVKDSLGAGPMGGEGFVRAMQEIFARSSDGSLAINFLALCEHRFRAAGDWGQDATAAVEAAAKAGTPLLFCDFPQEWTLGKVLPLYNSAWVQARRQRLDFLNDKARAVRALEAEELIRKDCVVAGHGGDLPALDYGLSLCRPAVGLVESEARILWLAERDPAMAAAVDDALAGRARSVSGKAAVLNAAKRAVLMVGCNHVEGIAKQLIATHGYQAVATPTGGWPPRGRSVERGGGPAASEGAAGAAAKGPRPGPEAPAPPGGKKAGAGPAGRGRRGGGGGFG